MRGKVLKTTCGSPRGGITPAYAGKSPSDRPRYVIQQDHPRLCGEKTDVVNAFNSGGGSPPPMRGKVADAEKVTKEDRITPAYAGKSHDFGKID